MLFGDGDSIICGRGFGFGLLFGFSGGVGRML